MTYQFNELMSKDLLSEPIKVSQPSHWVVSFTSEPITEAQGEKYAEVGTRSHHHMN